MDDKALLGKMRPNNKAAFFEMAALINKPTVAEALTTLQDAGLSAFEIALKFDIPALTLTKVLGRLRPFDRDRVNRGIALTRAKRYGLRLLDGTTLLEHCEALGITNTQSNAYNRERARLVREKQLVTAEEYQRAQRHREQNGPLRYEAFVAPPYGDTRS